MAGEFPKVKTLVTAGLADTYILLTNHQVSGVTAAEIESQLLTCGVRTPLVFGVEWLSQKIYESARLRALVPRVYGLGDLSQILDERAYEQAAVLLNSLRDTLRTFVPTSAYRRALDSLNSRGLVLLLGEPAAGKTTIASTLCLHAADAWEAKTIRLGNPVEFGVHWNPHEPRQLFWMDDAFGATQYQDDRVHEWNQELPLMRVALERGTRFILTSRDYIYQRAKAELKVGSLPVLHDAQIVVRVAELTSAEKELILYNHIRLGDQPKAFKVAIKGFLRDVATHPRFLPETARRLGSQFFTKGIAGARDEVIGFVAKPAGFLLETITGLAEDERAALAAIYAHGGRLGSPVSGSIGLSVVIGQLGSTLPRIKTALQMLDGCLTKLAYDDGSQYWTFQHPTVADAFGSYLAMNPELRGVYLEWANLEELLSEITAGEVGIQGVKVVVQAGAYPALATRLRAGLASDDHSSRVLSFLSYRAGREFLEYFLAKAPVLPAQLVPTNSYLSVFSGVRLLARLRSLGLLSEEIRQNLLGVIRDLSTDTPDADFLTSPHIRVLIDDHELAEIMSHVRATLQVDALIENFRDDYSSSQNDPESHFTLLKEAFEAYRRYYKKMGQIEEATWMRRALFKIERLVLQLREEEPETDGWSHDDDDYRPAPEPQAPSDRDPFDDVDE